MGYRYIGAKTKISKEIIYEISKILPDGGTVADLMCGTGVIALELRKKGYKVIASDVMYQAHHITKVKVLLQQAPPFNMAKKYFSKKGQLLLTEYSGYEYKIQNRVDKINDILVRIRKHKLTTRKYLTKYGSLCIELGTLNWVLNTKKNYY